jgi:hypothetical protein
MAPRWPHSIWRTGVTGITRRLANFVKNEHGHGDDETPQRTMSTGRMDPASKDMFWEKPG